MWRILRTQYGGHVYICCAYYYRRRAAVYKLRRARFVIKKVFRNNRVSRRTRTIFGFKVFTRAADLIMGGGWELIVRLPLRGIECRLSSKRSTIYFRKYEIQPEYITDDTRFYKGKTVIMAYLFRNYRFAVPIIARKY